jgi:hypothetical protein
VVAATFQALRHPIAQTRPCRHSGGVAVLTQARYRVALARIVTVLCSAIGKLSDVSSASENA